MNVDRDNGWSYNGTGSLQNLTTFNNPSSTLKAYISRIDLYAGTVDGVCDVVNGTYSYGNGSPFDTHLEIGNYSSDTVRITRRTGTVYQSGVGTYPDWAQTDKYTFTFSPEAVVSPGQSIRIRILCPSYPSNNQTLTINATSGRTNGKSISIYYENRPDKKKTPNTPSVSLQNSTSYTATTIDYVVTCSSTATHCNVKIYEENGNTRTIVSNGVMTNNRYYGSCTVQRAVGYGNGLHYIVASCRNDNSDWTNDSTPLRVDCSVPRIESPKITTLSQTTGTLQFTSDYNVRFYLNNRYLDDTTAEVDPKKEVALSSGTVGDYTLEVRRSDNNKITNSTTIYNVSTVPPKIVLTYKLYGDVCYITVTADSSCNEWRYFYGVVGEPKQEVKVKIDNEATGTSRITSIIENLSVGENGYQTYEIYAQAKKVSNNIEGTSNTVYPEISGGIRIYDEDEPVPPVPSGEDPEKWGEKANLFRYKSATIYIWHDGSWKRYLPYVYSEKEWKLGL